MSTVLLTAFAPYDQWSENASWLCLREVARELPEQPCVTTRRYGVDFAEARKRLADDLAAGYDYVLHLGQAPGSGRIALESVALNVGGQPGAAPAEYRPLESDGPVAYRSALPLADWSEKLRGAGIPSIVSYHAGTFLCNALLYWSHHLAARQGLRTRAALLHLPLETSQAVGQARDLPSLPAAITAAAVRIVLDELRS